MAKKEKLLSQEHMENIVIFVYNMLKDGYVLKYIKERMLKTENDNHICKIYTSLFDDQKKIILIVIFNKNTNKEIKLERNELIMTTNISSQFDFIQNKVNEEIENNKPIYYTDDEIDDVIGDPSLLGRRSKKVNHLVNNIETKKRKKILGLF